MENEKAQLSIVIPAYNEEKLIRHTLDHLFGVVSGIRDIQIEVILVDNASTDKTAEIASGYPLRVVPEPRRGISRARNRGAREAAGETVLFVDADTRPSREAIIAAMEKIREGYVFVGSTLTFDRKIPLLPRMVIQLWNTMSRILHWMAGAFMMIRKEYWEALGGMDDALFVSEELDFSRRLLRYAKKHKLKRGFILHREPVHTSSRKIMDYSLLETIQMILPLILHPFKNVRNIDACDYWYKRESHTKNN